MIAVWLVLAVTGAATAGWASSRGVHHATRAAAGLQVSPFVIGFTLVAIGTDLPEIANSVAASVAGHGDINVGDSIGSAAAQATLAIGVAPLLARAFGIARSNVALLGSATVIALLLGVLLMSDGEVSRWDGLALIAGWGLATAIVWRLAVPPRQPRLALPEHRPGWHVRRAIGYLLIVVAGASVTVLALVGLAEALGVPEYLVSFLGLALGTSLPELTVAVTAARQGNGDLALGDALGASLADASLSVGIGPVIAPTLVTTSLVVRGGLLTAAAVGFTTALLVARGRHDRLTGTLLVLAYLAMLPLLAASPG